MFLAMIEKLLNVATFYSALRKTDYPSMLLDTYLWMVECDSAVSETEKMKAIPTAPQRHIVAGLAAVVGGLVAPYERASHINNRPVLNWLWASGHHPFGPFSNTSSVSYLLRDTAKVSAIPSYF